MLPPDTMVMQAARHMRDRRVGAVLVTEGDCELVGIFTGRDAVSRVLAEGKDPAATTLCQVMTYNPDTMTPSRTHAVAIFQSCPKARSSGSCRAASSAVSNKTGSTRRPACGSQSPSGRLVYSGCFSGRHCRRRNAPDTARSATEMRQSRFTDTDD